MTEFAVLPVDGDAVDFVGRRLAEYLADFTTAWKDANLFERNRLARAMPGGATVENRILVKNTPRPELLPFFRTDK